MTINASFEVHPSILFRLGEDLISDEVQALAELIKNAYDADSASAVVRIVTSRGPDDHPDDHGYIQVIDKGHGMTLDEVREGWLTVSNSLKRRLKEAGATTEGGRTPLGDKGLGRLGAQRLGNRLSIVTTPSDGSETYSVSFDWRDFERSERLSDVAIAIETLPREKRPGTTIQISDLKSVERLGDVVEMERALAKVISPYQGVSAFNLHASVDGADLDLGGLETKLRKSASVHYAIKSNAKGNLEMVGKMRLAHLRPNSKKDRADFDRLRSDEGEAFLNFMRASPQFEDMRIKQVKGSRWWIEFRQTVRIEALRPVLILGADAEAEDSENERFSAESSGSSEQEESSGETLEPKPIALPGPFEGEVDIFNLGAGTPEDLVGFDSVKILREEVKELAGVRIYRDGFNVRVPVDWLGLGKGSTSGGSWYGLRPGNTMGYISISAGRNGQLVETTDREGFIQTSPYVNFEKLMAGFIKSANDVLEFVGRSYSDFRKSDPEPNDDGRPTEPSEITRRLGATLALSAEHRTALAVVRAGLADDAAEATELVDRYVDAGVDLNDADQELLVALNAIGNHASKAVAATAELETFIEDLDQQKRVGDRLQGEIELLEDQMSLTYETVGLGLTAEVLSHEISNIADRLARRTSDIAGHLKRSTTSDTKLIKYVEHVRGSVAGLRRQIAHLAPSLRYVRESRERILLASFVDDVQEYFESRWSSDKLRMEVTSTDSATVLINRGKLLQVLDNLILNNEYWLKEELRAGRIRQGVVTIEIEGSRVRVSDNGPGVDPEVENSLFEPHVTRKPSGLGRGLGLFVVRSLLAAEACEVDLLPERNEKDQRYILELDLSGVLSE